jgi:hypothetical protein
MKLTEAIDELPHTLVVRVEDVRPMAMNLDAADVLREAVAGHVGSTVDDKRSPTGLRRQAGEHRPE